MQNNIFERPLLQTPKFIKRALIFVLIFLAVLGGIALFADWQQTAFVSGRVITLDPKNRVQPITAPIEGRIVQWSVHEGEYVKKGKLIVELADNDPEIMLKLNRELVALEMKLKATKKAVSNSYKNFGRQKELLRDGIISQRQFEMAEIDYAKFLSEQSTVEGDLARLNLRVSRQSRQEIYSEIDGVIQKILVGSPTEQIKTGQVLGSIVPYSNQRVVEAYVEGRDLPFIYIDQKVRLQFEGWPVVHFSGWPENSVGMFHGKIRIIDSADDGNGRFRIIIEPIGTWPSHEKLRQGVKVRGYIQLNAVPVWFEIWRRLNNFPMSYVNDPRDGKKENEKSK